MEEVNKVKIFIAPSYNIVSKSLKKLKWSWLKIQDFLALFLRNIVREPKYAFHDDDCTKITDAEGNIPQTRWVAHIRKYVQK